MPMQFYSRRKQRKKRRTQYALAFIALALVLIVLVSWLATRYHLSGAGQEPDPSASSTPLVDEPVADTAATLLILNEEEQEQFILLQASPARQEICAVSIPAILDAGDGRSLADTLQKNGSPRVKEAVAKALELPIAHYISLDAAAVESYMNYLESGLTFSLPETVSYTDEGGLTVRMEAGERQLTANQVRRLLQYDGWKESATAQQVAADLIAAILNQYLLPQRSYGGDFAALANLVQTDIRIDHYNAYRTTLQYLADSNTAGSLCRTIMVSGSTTPQGLFDPDLDALRQDTPLYD